MSHSARYDWELQRERRRQEYLARISSVTERFLERYESILSNLESQGLDRHVPKEIAAAHRSVQQIRGALFTDPEQARDLSQSAGPSIHALPQLARAAREVARREEQAATAEFQRFLDSILGKIEDPVERDFARHAVAELRDQYGQATGTAADLQALKARLAPRVDSIRYRAAEDAATWKQQRAQEHQAKAQTEMLEEARSIVLPEVQKNPDAFQQMEEIWNALEAQAAATGDAFSAALHEAIARTDEVVVDENCRRATVRAVYASLEKTGFVVEPPRLVREGRDEVVILARKPSGAQAEFKVTVDGGMSYKFDRYDGQACRKDIDQVMPMLQKIYGVQLSNERVLWENPDRLSRDAKPIAKGEVKHG